MGSGCCAADTVYQCMHWLWGVCCPCSDIAEHLVLQKRLTEVVTISCGHCYASKLCVNIQLYPHQVESESVTHRSGYNSMPVFPNTVHARIQPSIPLPESQPGCFKSIQHRAQLRSQPPHCKSAQRHALAWPSPSAHWHGGLPFMLHWQPTPSMIKPSPALQQQPALCIARLPLCCTDHPIGPSCTARLPVLLCNTAATPSPPRPHTSPPGPAALACRPCYGWRHMHCCCISAKASQQALPAQLRWLAGCASAAATCHMHCCCISSKASQQALPAHLHWQRLGGCLRPCQQLLLQRLVAGS